MSEAWLAAANAANALGSPGAVGLAAGASCVERFAVASELLPKVLNSVDSWPRWAEASELWRLESAGMTGEATGGTWSEGAAVAAGAARGSALSPPVVVAGA